MPALVKTPARLPRFVPHFALQSVGANTGAGSFPPGCSTVSESRNTSANIEELAHDARNVLSSLVLYGELLAMPGVLSPQCTHHAQELQGITRATTRMVEALIEQVSVAPNLDATPALPNAIPTSLPAVPVTDAAEELRHLQPLLAAIAGPAIQLSVATMPCAGRTALAVEDLTRILINLVRNSADAIPTGGHIRITAQYDDGFSFLDYNNANDIFGPPRSVVITVADDGPGVPESRREQIFETGYSTRHNHGDDRLAPRRRGLGLSIVRNLVDAAGGTVRLAPQQQRGARFDIQLPITSGMYGASTNTAFAVTQA